jgi:glucose-6-phosphate isomerase
MKLPEEVMPYAVLLDLVTASLSYFNKKSIVRLSDLRDFFFDKAAVDRTLLGGQNPIVYEVYDNSQPQSEGHLNFGVTVISPGKVGSEYFMTRGHYHTKEHTSEVYLGIEGEGVILLQRRSGEVACLPIMKGKVIYVPPSWAHRTINTGDGKFSFFYVYSADAGHDYESIRKSGFAKLVVEKGGKPEVVDNPNFIA